MYKLRFVLMTALAIAACGPLAAQERLAVKGGKIIPVAGPPIEGGVVLIRGGKIEAVGKDVKIPADGKVIVPGFVEAHSTRGMDQVNETNPNVPFLSVVDSIDPSQDYFEECRRNGVTTAAIIPGNTTMLGGQGAVVKTAGTYVDEMVVKRSVGIKISLKPVGDRNRMGQLAALRKELDGARDAVADAKKLGSTGGAAAADADAGDFAATDTQPRPGRRQGGGRPMGQTQPNDADAAL